MPVWTAWVLGIVGAIIVNAFVWVFLWGRSRGRTNTRLDKIEDDLSNPKVLPECHDIFNDIREKLSRVVGNVEILLMITKENQKNSEKRQHETGRRKPR